MEKYKLSSAMRFFFLGLATMIIIGIGLTGFRTVHWFLYIPPIMFAFAAATGICPGMIFSKMLFKEKQIELKKI